MSDSITEGDDEIHLPYHFSNSIDNDDYFSSNLNVFILDNENTTEDFPYSVIALKPHTGDSFDEISFRKEDKFNVVRKETEHWLVGEINGKRGLFPRDKVKVIDNSVIRNTYREITQDNQYTCSRSLNKKM